MSVWENSVLGGGMQTFRNRIVRPKGAFHAGPRCSTQIKNVGVARLGKGDALLRNSQEGTAGEKRESTS